MYRPMRKGACDGTPRVFKKAPPIPSPKSMLIPHTILFQSDQFWEKLNLNVLRRLISTCKGFRTELLRKDAGKTLLDQALLTLTSHGPTISLATAKRCFFLKLDAMAKHCAMLPQEDPLHLNEEERKTVHINTFRFHIRFIDAYNMACKSGLKAAMERRHRSETKLLNAGRKTAAELKGRFRPLSMNIREAQAELIQNLTALRKDNTSKKRLPGENMLRKGIKQLKQLGTDVAMANLKVRNLAYHNTLGVPSLYEIKRYVTELKKLRKTLVARYKAHTVYCPGRLTTDCLAGLE